MALRTIGLILSCVVAPVLAVCIGTLLFFAGDKYIADDIVGGWLGVGALGAWLGLVVGVPTMLLLGLPLHAHFQKHGRTSLVHYVAAGSFAGLLASVLFGFLPWGAPNPLEVSWDRIARSFLSYSAVRLILIGALTGALAATIFRQLWLIRRPDRDQSASASNDTSA